MSGRKILFLIIIGVLFVAGLLFLWKVSWNSWTPKKEKVDTLTLWVVWGTTEQYDTLFADFGKYAPEYSKTKISVRVFPDHEQYQRILLSTLADGKWPDIIGIEAWGDDLLEKQITLIPEDYIDIKDFEKKYEDIFLPLLVETGSKDAKTRSIKGIPLGYETLGLFYNKSLLRTLPKTWNDVSVMYDDASLPGVLPINLGMWPRFVPDATDIISYFLISRGITDYAKMEWSDALSEYTSYSEASTKNPSGENSSVEWGEKNSLILWKDTMETEKISTIDLFMRWKIAIIVWYPSLAWEIEKAYKRAGSDATDGLILTERLPQDSLGKSEKNIARYQYLAVSNKSSYQIASAKLLEYLGTETIRRKTIEIFPGLISPEKSYYQEQENSPLSRLFARAQLSAFIPSVWEKLEVFHYGEKRLFTEMLGDYLDRNEKTDNNILENITKAVKCELESLENANMSDSCMK